ncbi:MAG: ABC transporter ATP-binding protein [Lachnospiraceae bacterium]|nr:ABC transporter ATP-binding protein [Lachnospiraceae bacterium]
MLRTLSNVKGKNRWFAFLCLLLVGGQVYLDLLLPDYTKEITLLINTESTNLNDYFICGGKMLACALLSAALAVIVGYLAAAIASDLSFTIRGRLFRKVSSFGAAEIKQFSTASLITRTTNDITQIQMFVAMGLQVMIKAPIMAVWALLKITGRSWELTAVTAAGVAVIVVTILILMAILLPKFKIVQTLVDDVNRVTRENLTGLRVVRAFNAEAYQEEKFEVASTNLKNTQLFTLRGMAFLFPIMSFVSSSVSLAIYTLGAYLIERIPMDNSSIQGMIQSMQSRAAMMGDVVAFSSYAMFIIMSFLMLLMIIMIFPRAQVSANRINEVLDAPISVISGSRNSQDGVPKGTIEFKDVSFRYPGASEDCLKHISFTAGTGETVAIIGATGSGKSTLVGLAARLYDATSGEILIDGMNIKDYSFDALYPKLGYVQQKAFLFADSIRNNIAFGTCDHEFSREDIDRALEISQAFDFVAALEEGTQSPVSQGGSNVSGGQKQRLSIARAVARQPEILIFDDSFSALDYKTDRALRQALAREMSGTTCLIVAQRIGTIRHADRIIVLDDGEIAGMGTHDELMASCQVYQEIALSQLSAEELA